MSNCMTKRCDTEKITGSGYCLKCWINQRYFVVIIAAWISGIFVNSSRLPQIMFGCVFTVFTALMYYRTGSSVEELQNHISEVLKDIPEGG